MTCRTYRLYHGTNRDFDCKDIEVYRPRYIGGLGEGIYFAETPEDAKYYGNRVCEYDVQLCKPLVISPESDTYRIAPEIEEHYNTTGAYDSILTGESIVPFDVKIGKRWYKIRDGDDLESIGDLAKSHGYDSVIARGLRMGSGAGSSEVLVFDKSAIQKALSYDRRPSELS